MVHMEININRSTDQHVLNVVSWYNSVSNCYHGNCSYRTITMNINMLKKKSTLIDAMMLYFL